MVLPSLIVSTTLMSLIAIGRHLQRILVEDHEIGEFARLKRSLRLLLPCTGSAALMVMAFSASSGVTRWSAPITAPPRDTRLTAVHITNIWSSGATLKSVWLVGPQTLVDGGAHRAQEIGLRLAALATCVSPK